MILQKCFMLLLVLPIADAQLATKWSKVKSVVAKFYCDGSASNLKACQSMCELKFACSDVCWETSACYYMVDTKQGNSFCNSTSPVPKCVFYQLSKAILPTTLTISTIANLRLTTASFRAGRTRIKRKSTEKPKVKGGSFWISLVIGISVSLVAAVFLGLLGYGVYKHLHRRGVVKASSNLAAGVTNVELTKHVRKFRKANNLAGERMSLKSNHRIIADMRKEMRHSYPSVQPVYAKGHSMRRQKSAKTSGMKKKPVSATVDSRIAASNDDVPVLERYNSAKRLRSAKLSRTKEKPVSTTESVFRDTYASTLSDDEIRAICRKRVVSAKKKKSRKRTRPKHETSVGISSCRHSHVRRRRNPTALQGELVSRRIKGRRNQFAEGCSLILKRAVGNH